MNDTHLPANEGTLSTMWFHVPKVYTCSWLEFPSNLSGDRFVDWYKEKGEYRAGENLSVKIEIAGRNAHVADCTTYILISRIPHSSDNSLCTIPRCTGYFSDKGWGWAVFEKKSLWCQRKFLAFSKKSIWKRISRTKGRGRGWELRVQASLTGAPMKRFTFRWEDNKT